MKVLEKNRAIELRKQGRTFREITQEIPVSKGSLSYWLRGVTLTPGQLARIQYKNDEIKKKFIAFNELRKKRSEDNKKNVAASAIQENRRVVSHR